jgi:hypothetical protein
MSSPRKRTLLPGLLGASLPLVLQAVGALLLFLWFARLDKSAPTFYLAQGTIQFIGLVSAGSTAALALVLFFLSAGRNVPAVVPVVLALVPWLAGLSRALKGTRSVIANVASGSQNEQCLDLIYGAGEVVGVRMLGVWSSTALLLATAGALFMAREVSLGTSPAPGGLKAGGRRLEAGVVALLALLCALATFESSELYQVLTGTAMVHEDYQTFVLFISSQELRAAQMARLAVLVGLVLAGLVLGGRLMRRPRKPAAVLTLAPLVAVVAGILWADTRPMARMGEALEQVAQPPAPLSGLRLLSWGKNEDFLRLDVVATARGLSRLGGTEVPWSAGDEALIDVLQVPAGSLGRQESIWAPPSLTLEVAVEAGIPVSELRRLLDLTTQMELPSLCLVGRRIPESEAARLSASLSGTPALLGQAATALWSMPRATHVLLPPMLQVEGFNPGSTWVAELGAGHRVVLSKLSGGASETLALVLSGPDPKPNEVVPQGTLLYLAVTEQASPEDVTSAVRRSQAQGFSVLLSARPPPGTHQP